jgi:hypothetical protein
MPRLDAPDVLTFPEDARWGAERQAVEFGVQMASTAVWSGSRGASSNDYCQSGPPAERCIGVYHLQRTRFESIPEPKLRRRQLTEDGNAEISLRDLCY